MRRRTTIATCSIYDAAVDALDAARSARDTWWQHRYPDCPGPIAYFSAEFALHQSLPIYAGGLGVLAGDHCKEASDLGHSRSSASVSCTRRGTSTRRSPQRDGSRKSYERLSWAHAPIEPRRHARGQALHRGGAARQSQRARLGVARAPRPREAVPARHRSRGERALGPRAVGAPVRRRSRNTRAAGNHPRHRRRARAEGHGGAAGGVAPERRARGIRRPAAHPRSDRAGRHVRLGARGSAAHDDLHHPHARCRPATTRSRSTSSKRIWRTHGARSGAYRDAFMALGHYDNGSGPLFNMTALALRTAGATNAVSQLHGEVTREMWGPIWPGVPETERPGPRHHQRHPRAHVAVGRDERGCSTITCGAGWRDRHDDIRDLGRNPRDPGRGALGRAAVAAHVSVRVHPRAGAVALDGRTRQRGARRRGRHPARSQRADDRVRAPVHRLQAAGADLPQPGPSARAF